MPSGKFSVEGDIAVSIADGDSGGVMRGTNVNSSTCSSPFQSLMAILGE